MFDTEDTLAPSAEIDTAPVAAAEPAHAESAQSAPEAAESGSEQKLTLADVVGQAIDKAEAEAAPAATQAPEGASPAPTDTPKGGEPASSDAPADAASAAAPAEDAADEASEAADESDLTPAELAALPKKTQRRMQRLLKDRGRFKEAATAYENITSYMAENRLSGEEVAVGFDLMAKLKKGDAAGFLKAIDPYVRSARMAIGEELPGDVRQKVDAGFVDEETAKEVARTRAAAARNEALLREREAEDEARQGQALAASVRDALNSWDRANSTNPDFTASRTALLAYARETFQARPPRSAAEALERVNAYWKTLSARAPAPRPVIAPTPSSTHATARPVAREPKTLAEAISIGLDQAYAKMGRAS